MKKQMNLWVLALLFVGCTSSMSKGTKQSKDGWISLFDGTSLNGWRASENPNTFSVENGAIVVHGPRAHLFYEGPVQNHEFTNFEFKAQVMTTPGSNSGMFIHTAYQDTGWPSKGYEIQVNNSHTDWRRTGSLYAVQDVKEQIVKDNEWYTEQITVQGKRITIKINDKTVVDYTEPDSIATKNMGGKMLSNGTVALQGHDPESKVYFKDVMIKPLP